MYSNPRINNMISKAERDLIVRMGSYNHKGSILIMWDYVKVCLDKTHPSLAEDSRVLLELGFKREDGTKHKFIKSE